jgi:S1-C subfamily serine protease
MWWIQTDADVFQGNSGGPLLNENGEVVGMNSLMLAKEGGSYGFAIPFPLIKKIINDLEKYKEVRWASLGVGLDGATIKSVAPGSAAVKAGIKVNDKILGMTVNNQEISVNSSMDLIVAMSIINNQQEITLGVKRDEDIIAIKITPGFKLNTDYQ